MKTTEVTQTFVDLKKIWCRSSPPLPRTPTKSATPVCTVTSPPTSSAFCLSVIERFGFRSDSWRLDPTVHPFASNSATTDIRITTKYPEDFINPSVFGSMHECGHGLYENGVSRRWSARCCVAAHRWAYTNRNRGCGRTWWDVAAPRGNFLPKLQATFPTPSATWS